MSLPADYISGTITLTNGSPNFTGTGTGWQAADFREGDILLGVEDHAGQVYVIAAITGNAAGTLTQDWAGTSGTYTYRMRYEWDSSRVSAQARAMVELLGNGNLESIAGLTGPGVVVLEGPHSAGIRPFSDFVNGVAYNVQVDTLPDRAAYDGQSAGFAVLVSDMGDGRSALFSKASNTSGDWTDAAYITGPVGPAPEIEATVTSLPPGSTATVTPTPITGGVRLDFELPEAEGFYWFSAYDPDEAYIKDSVVRHNRSAFIATQVVPVGESPSNAFPPVDNTYWDVLAAGGANGEGTVSSVEPGSGIAVDATDPTNPVISLDAAFTDLKDVDFTTNPPEVGNVPVWDGEKFIPGAGGGNGVLPSGPTSERPAPASNGMMRYNEDFNVVEAFVDGEWSAISTRGFPYEIEYLVLGGGGAGSRGTSGSFFGGGGAGAVPVAGSMLVSPGDSLNVIIGAGGAGNATDGTPGGDGSQSSLGAINGPGGAGGLASGTGGSNSLYSGGVRNTPASGGGAGAGANGVTPATTTTGGAGGAGSTSSISSVPTQYGGGGGGASTNGGAGGAGGGGAGATTNGIAGTANRGAGGGGGGSIGGAGGSGIVIIRYLGAQKAVGGVVVEAAGYTIHTFTASGTFVG